MRRALCAAVVVCALAPTMAVAKPHHVHHRHRIHAGGDPRPAAWCGWQMRQWLGVADRALNEAKRWASSGSAASGPAIGVIVVWWHHVGIIVGRADNGEWIVKSGNDGHAVRERARSLRGVIAYRWPGSSPS